MKILVTGGRDFYKPRTVWATLDILNDRHGIVCVVHGVATGADTLAGEWADMNGIDVEPYPIMPGENGFQRNSRMLEASIPHAVVQFPGGNGTKDMVTKALLAEYDVWFYKDVLEPPDDPQTRMYLPHEERTKCT